MKRNLKNEKALMLFAILILALSGCRTTKEKSQWDKKYDFVYDIRPILFHYDHGILAGSYPLSRETVEISFNEVCKYLGHVCLCGAGGYMISEMAVQLIKEGDEPPERGDFVLVSSRDHTVSDVVSYVLGCSRRNDPEQNRYFVDTSIQAPKREYHYYIGYPPAEKAVHILYRKHLLIGNEQMDRLWKVELAYEEDPTLVSPSDMEEYRNTMLKMVKDVLSDSIEGLFEAESIDYDTFLSIQKKLNPELCQ